MIHDCLYSSRSDEWETPQAFFNALDKEFRFTLDACATSDNAKCARFFNRQADGLTQSWSGETVWCNPPYGRDIARWTRKAYEASLQGATVVLLIHARTDTRWFHDWVYNKAELRFVKGRLRFGGSKNSAPFPSLVAVFRPRN